MLTTISVSVFQVPSLGRLSVPISRMLSCPVPFQGTREAAATGGGRRRREHRWLRAGRARGSGLGRGRRRCCAFGARAGRVEDVLDRSQRLEVVVGHGGVGATHHEEDREQAGQGDGGERRAGRSQPAGAAVRDAVQVPDDPVRIDRRHDPVEVGNDVPDQDPDQNRRLQGDAEDLDLVAEHGPREQGKRQERRRGECHGPVPGPGVGVPEPGEEEAQERRGERRSGARTGFLRLVHRG